MTNNYTLINQGHRPEKKLFVFLKESSVRILLPQRMTFGGIRGQANLPKTT